MISWMQKHKKYLVITVWISTIAFVGAGFVGWGAYKYGGASHDTIAKVGNIEVTNKDLQNNYTKLFNYFNNIYGGTLTQEKAKQLNLENMALQQLFSETLYLNYAKELGLDASDKEILKEIAKIPSFQVGGIFNENRYNTVLRSMQSSSYEFKKNIKKSIIIQKLFKALNLPNTDLELKAVYAIQNLQDKLKIKIINGKDITLNITEEDIKTFWLKNKEKYKSLTKYVLDIVKVNAKDFKVTQDEAKEYYTNKKFMFKDNSGKILPFSKVEKKVIEAVQMKKAKKGILRKYIQLKNGKIKAQSSIEIDRLNTAIPMQKIIKAKKGDYIRSIQIQDGYICAFIKDIIPPKILSFEKAKKFAENELRNKLIQEKLIQLGKENIKNFNNAKDIGFVTKNDINKFKEILNIQEATKFLNFIFTQEEKKGFFPLEDKVIIYHITEQKLFDEKLFETSKNDIKNKAASIKESAVENSLLKELSKKYEITKYYKQKG